MCARARSPPSLVMARWGSAPRRRAAMTPQRPTAPSPTTAATDVVRERGDAAVERVRELTGGLGAHSVLECVGLEQAVVTALEIVRPGGAVGRVGLPEHDSPPTAIAFRKNA